MKLSMHASPFYEKMHGLISGAALRCIVVEFQTTEYVKTITLICRYSLRKSHGLPCACYIERYT